MPASVAGGKPDWVTNSAYDILHAYRTACIHSQTLVYDNVLIVQDNATFRKCSSVQGVHFLMPVSCFAHATVWSRASRQCLSDIQDVCWPSGDRITDVDADFICKIKRVYTYTIPLAFQLLPDGENRREWTHFLSPHTRKAADVFIGATVHLLRLHKYHRPGWDIIHAPNIILPSVVGLASLPALMEAGLMPVVETPCPRKHQEGLF